LLPSCDTYIPRRYRFNPEWKAGRDTQLQLVFNGPGQCKGKVSTFNRTTLTGCMSKLKQLKRYIRTFHAGTSWWDHDVISVDNLAVACVRYHICKGTQPKSIENILEGASYAACLLVGHIFDWRKLLPQATVALRAWTAVCPRKPTNKAKGRVPRWCLDVWGEELEKKRVRGTAKYGTAQWKRWGGRGSSKEAKRDSRLYEEEYRYFHCAMGGDCSGMRSGEYLETDKDRNPARMSATDFGLVGNALKLTDFVSPTVSAPASGRCAASITDQKANARYNKVIFDRRRESFLDFMTITADRHGFARSNLGVAALLNFKNSREANRIGIVPFYSNPRAITDLNLLHRKKVGRPRRHQLVNSGTYNVNLKKYLLATAKARPEFPWDLDLIQDAASHGHRKEFCFREFMKAVQAPGDSKPRLAVLATRLRWKSEDMVQLYATYNHGQLSKLMEVIDATDARASRRNYVWNKAL
jgi:hypothetical protein